ncbi:MAG: malonyl-CoA decarboxylase, partial [Pseudomonadota bacterium]
MLGLKKFLTLVADKGKSFFGNLFTRKKDTATHLTELCEQLISEDGVVSGITIAREFWHLYEKSNLEEKEKFFLEANKKF